MYGSACGVALPVGPDGLHRLHCENGTDLLLSSAPSPVGGESVAGGAAVSQRDRLVAHLAVPVDTFAECARGVRAALPADDVESGANPSTSLLFVDGGGYTVELVGV